MAEERKVPRVGGSRTLNADGTEVKATAPKPESKLEVRSIEGAVPKATKKKTKE